MYLLRKFAFLPCILLVGLWAGDSFGQGIIFPLLGPVNRSMGGAATAAPIDAIGANYWNPATISDFEDSEISVGLDLVFPRLETSSSVANGAISGTSVSETGVIPLPQVGWVHKTNNPNVTVGLGIIAVGGAKTNYGSSTTNPVFFPQPLGFGQVFTEAQFLQIVPSIGLKVTDRLSIGFSPIVNLAQLVVVPNVFAAPDDANGDGVPTYPAGRGSQFRWGGGAQLGFFYRGPNCWNLGAAIKTPQWIQSMEFVGSDELGGPRVDRATVDLPLLVSVGISYDGNPKTTYAVDVRYTNYASANGLGESGFAPDGSIQGLGYDDALTVAAGVQRHMSERFTLRGGYTFTSSVLEDEEAIVGVLAPLFYNHIASGGASFRLNQFATIDVAYSYIFEATLDGPILTAAGPVPDSAISTSISGHFASFGIGVGY